ncbi:ABC transporter permease [Paenibacillus thalictri]|uniref:Sugar ABC transporter permease n=1 Tax=Paenibacillus thalictri TaxID=2527873 RepID=A0A4Q9DJK8_9BACL|nr:sugar ABC transporter permease [Paenibacillus thalictri]TBL71623.1 sugar ABC transporter permease [Paenibacillus thalictri]
METAVSAAAVKPAASRFGYYVKNRWLYVLLLPGIVYFVLFKYVPMWGILIAFMDYQPFLGVTGSPWVGLEHFEMLVTDPAFTMLLGNTFILAIYNIVFYFPLPIIVALLLHEVRHMLYKRLVQTVIYVPHFVSWVIVIGIAYIFFTTEGGLVNEIIASLGWDKIPFLTSSGWFRSMILAEIIWKESGWGTIIFLAAIAGVDPQLYEAARMDGAGRFRQLWHVTLPAIRSTIVILLILRLGNFLDTGFEQIFLSLNATNREVGEVFDTYVYRLGLQEGRYSYSTAIGLFKSVVGFVMLAGANYLAKRLGEEGVY